MDHTLHELEALARQFHTDKQAGQNGYLPLYLEYFKRHGIERDAKLKILEIGTNKGSSLRMWAEYFPNAQVYGIDVTRTYEVPDIVTHPRITTLLVDSGNPIKLEQAILEIADFDIIIDDGSHDQADQQNALGCLFFYLKCGGLYVIEDIITGEPWWDGRTYNKKQVTPTRNLVKLLEAQVAITKVEVIAEDDWDYFMKTLDYCHYHETPEIIYQRHHPQIAFLGKKHG